MPTILKSFQFSVLFHIAFGSLIVLSMSKNNISKQQMFLHKTAINLTGLSTGTIRAQASSGSMKKESIVHSTPVVKKNVTAEKIQLDFESEVKGDFVKSESVSSGTGPLGGEDFNENIQSYSEPQYPKAALKRGLQGTMKIKIFIGKDGIPTETQLLQSSGHQILDNSALEAVKKWIFKKNNRSAFYVVKTIIFQLKS